jgi:hypothetical protein
LITVFLQYLPVGILRILLNSFRYATGKTPIKYDTFDAVYQDTNKNMSLTERKQKENEYTKKAFDEIQNYLNTEISHANPMHYELSKDRIPIQLWRHLNITHSIKADYKTVKIDNKADNPFTHTPTFITPEQQNYIDMQIPDFIPPAYRLKHPGEVGYLYPKTVNPSPEHYFPGLETKNETDNDIGNDLTFGNENNFKSTVLNPSYDDKDKNGVDQFKEGRDEGKGPKERVEEGGIRITFEQFVTAAVSAALTSSTPSSPFLSEESSSYKEHSSFSLSASSHSLPFPFFPTQQNPSSLNFKFPIHPGQLEFPGQPGYPDQPEYSVQPGPPVQFGYPDQPGYPAQPGYTPFSPPPLPTHSPSLSNSPFLLEGGLEGFSFHPAANIRDLSYMGECGNGKICSCEFDYIYSFIYTHMYVYDMYIYIHI